jgi:uncharacterized protein YjbI with pentapeptide repeats
MANLTRDDVLKKIAAGESLERADLRGIDLSHASLEGADFHRADLEGSNLEGAKLKKARLRNANLRESFLAGADLVDANLDRADLEGAKLAGADLTGANLNRATLEGADLANAKLGGARLTNAQLDSANLAGADLTKASASHVELGEACLAKAKLAGADLSNANMKGAVLEHADLTGANLSEADLVKSRANGANFARAVLTNADLAKAILSGADLTGADLRHAKISDAKLDSAKLTGAKVAGLTTNVPASTNLSVDWLDASPEGNGSKRVQKAAAIALLSGQEIAQSPTGRRYFGKGDVLRNATLEFGDGATIEVESRFEHCAIAIGSGTELIVGEQGVLSDCTISGGGNITIHGQFFERKSPGIVGPKQLIVSASGSLVGAVQQPEGSTRFAFEPGCKLRMKIMNGKTESSGDAENAGERRHRGSA